MNPVIRAQLKAFATSNPNSNLEEHALFEVFTIYAVTNGILTDSIDPFSAHLHGDEFGLDGIAIMVQGEICRTSDEVRSALGTGKKHEVEFNLFQSKTSENIDYGQLSKFFDAAYNYFDGDFINPSNQLIDLIAAKDTVYDSALKKNPIVRLFFASTGTGEVSKQIRQLIDTNRTRFSDLNIFSEVDISVLGANDLQSGYRSATNSISGRIDIEKPITLPQHSSAGILGLG
jgi:hypothetical protein